MRITVTAADLSSAVDHGSVIQLTGTAENGDPVTFSGQRSLMFDLSEAALSDGAAAADVEPWQITEPEPEAGS